MKKNVCIHAHFYQPPRENPWLEEIELQDSAFPYHDWNERINLECYAANGSSRIVDGENKILDIVNNYSLISFNFGPTLLSWMQEKDKIGYEKILEADKESIARLGFGSALAQCYNHMIMPLANSLDKSTQIYWGIKDFEYRFKRKPEGMWLPETAVDLKSLEMLADHGIKFTVLAPNQAKRVKRLNEDNWTDVNGDMLDPKKGYLCKLPSGKKIALFFYEWHISRELAFGALLHNGGVFAKRLVKAFEIKDEAQIVNIATDGETYGHHRHFADMALAFCLKKLKGEKEYFLTNYARFLKDFPIENEAEVHENSSWSCAHGVGRWQDDCGCSLSQRSDWNQKWRKNLRGTLNWLRDAAYPLYEEKMKKLTVDPVMARNEYIFVILDRSQKSLEVFFSKIQGSIKIDDAKKTEILKLMEMQRHAMLMFTSCGWFFDDISRIETVQILLYAARVMQLVKEVFKVDLEKEFQNRLKEAKSNHGEIQDGAFVYENFVKPSILDFSRIAIHAAIYSLFKETFENISIKAYEIEMRDSDLIDKKPKELLISRVEVKSKITWDKKAFICVVLRIEDHQLVASSIEETNTRAKEIVEKIKEKFQEGHIIDAVNVMKEELEGPHYTFWHLLKDEQHLILNNLLGKTLEGVKTSLQDIRRHYTLIEAINEHQIHMPKIFLQIIQVLFSNDLLESMENIDVDLKILRKIVFDVQKWPIEIDKEYLGYKAKITIDTLLKKLTQEVDNLSLLQNIVSYIEILNMLGLGINLWEAQNLFFNTKKNNLERMRKKEDEKSKQWIELFQKLAKLLYVKT